MAEAKVSFPMITEQRWWALRERLKKSLPPRITPAYLNSVLDISEKTAAAVELPTLKRLGLVTKDGTPTDLAKRWRDDQQYAQVCVAIRETVYPEELLHAAPDPVADEEAATRWFMNQGEVGERAAANMARSYRLLGLATPKQLGEKTERRTKPKAEDRTAKRSPKATPSQNLTGKALHIQQEKPAVSGSLGVTDFSPSLHIDIQIHISADAKPEQIDQVFASMSKHLYGRNE